MLVLTRNREESLILKVPPSTEPTEICVLVIRPHGVRLGIEAPTSVQVTRDDAKKKGPRERKATGTQRP